MSLPKRAVAVALLLSAQGCHIDFKRPGGPKLLPNPIPVAKESRQFGDSRGGRFGPKIVEDKKKPSRLLARDGTSCTVSDKKYHSTNLGASVWCTWYRTDR